MGTYRLVKPGPEHEAVAWEIQKEFQETGMSDGNFCHMRRFLTKKSYAEWLERLRFDRTRKKTETDVPTDTFFLEKYELNQAKIIGLVSVRLDLNRELGDFAGHIGYSDRPSERILSNSMNIAAALFLGMHICKAHGLEAVMLSSDAMKPDNVNAIRAVGGKLLYEDNFKDVFKNITPIQIYVVDLETALIERMKTIGPWISEFPVLEDK